MFRFTECFIVFFSPISAKVQLVGDQAVRLAVSGQCGGRLFACQIHLWRDPNAHLARRNAHEQQGKMKCCVEKLPIHVVCGTKVTKTSKSHFELKTANGGIQNKYAVWAKQMHCYQLNVV